MEQIVLQVYAQTTTPRVARQTRASAVVAALSFSAARVASAAVLDVGARIDAAIAARELFVRAHTHVGLAFAPAAAATIFAPAVLALEGPHLCLARGERRERAEQDREPAKTTHACSLPVATKSR